jgi:outer membrane protein OmpA-like peptidoglycan-associated protein
MKPLRRIATIVLGLSLAACGHSSLLLLPDEDGGHGAVAVLESDGRPVDAVVSQPDSRTRLGDPTPAPRPLGGKGLSSGQLALLSGLPPPPRSYTLYFVEGTTDLTAESRPVLDELRAEIARRPGADVEVTGHTDTVGSTEDNDALSQRRAMQILDLLATVGIDRSLMTAVGRGERELRQPTLDNVESALNRRVEVSVR